MIILLFLKWLFLHLKLITSLAEELLPSMSGWPVIVFSLVFSVYWYGHIHGVDSCEATHAKAESKMEKKHDKIKTNTNSLSNTQLDKRLRPYTRD